MGAIPRSIEPDIHTPPMLARGRVIVATETGFAIDTEDGRVEAGLAASCLLRPRPGDQVLLVDTGDAGRHVLAVLERQDGPATLEVAGADCLEMNAPTLTLRARRSATIDAPALALSADELRISSKLVRYAAGLVKGCATQIEVLARSLRSVAEHSSHQSDTHHRTVRRTDSLVAGDVVQTARNTFTVSSHTAVIDAKADVRIDGERISMG